MNLFKKVAGFFFWIFLQILLLPKHFGAPGYFFIGCMGFLVLNSISLVNAVLDWERPDFFWPELNKSIFQSLTDDGREICRYL